VEQKPDLVVLDVMMPGQDGVETLRALRKTSDVPVIMLTALGETSDRLRGLEAGADDYLAKPFAARELLLRVRAVLKRTTTSTDDSRLGGIITAGPLQLDLDRQSVRLDDQPLQLTSTEFRLLSALVEKQNSVVTRRYLSQYATGRELQPFDRTLDTHISNLRHKIAKASNSDCVIQSVRGSGYRLTAG
jgi:two-component system, OmpR family, response regulator CpxR